jgi:Ala-tRNA(Pro) deacylase
MSRPRTGEDTSGCVAAVRKRGARDVRGPRGYGRRRREEAYNRRSDRGGTIMIPSTVEAHLRERYRGYEHHVHAPADTALDLAAAEHVTGDRVAKPVVLRLDGKLAIAVVRATDRVDLAALERATWARAEIVPEGEFSKAFLPCEPGAEPPFAMFGARILVDEKLMRAPKLVMPAGTHQDAVILDTTEWMACELVAPVAGLGRPRSDAV